MKAGVPVEAEPEAERVLQEIPPAALGRVLTAIREWLSEVPATSIKIRHFVDPEDEGWEEAVVEVHLVSDSGTALTLWDDLGGRIDSVVGRLPQKEQAIFRRHFGVHLVWRDDARVETNSSLAR